MMNSFKEIEMKNVQTKTFEHILEIIQCSFEAFVASKENNIIITPFVRDDESISYIISQLEENGSQLVSITEIKP